jgi:histidinol-phosphate aminotransferase
MRAIIRELTPYHVKNAEGYTLLDNNENFLNLLQDIDLNVIKQNVAINRYPSDNVDRLVAAYAAYVGLPAENVLAANGSDEWIALICQFALDPTDTMMVVSPDFSMYEKNGRLLGATVQSIALNEDFSLPLQTMLQEIEQWRPKCLFLSNPCNPTGRRYEVSDLDTLAIAMANVGGYFVVDEAYIEFAGGSYTEKAIRNENVIVLRTASKALGMAGLRLGFLIANRELINDILRIKPPYNVNQMSAVIGAAILSQPGLLRESLKRQKRQIEQLKVILEEFSSRHKKVQIYPSHTNFFLMETPDALDLYQFLNRHKIRVRAFGDGRLRHCLRISAGSETELTALKKSLEEWSLSACDRQAN